MGVKATTTVEYTCDMCRKPTQQPFEAEQRILWQDRDVSARTKVSASIEIDYCPGAVVLCRPCAANLMRREADLIDPPAREGKQ
jgi:hypothetical protein